MNDSYRGFARVRIDPDGTSTYPLLIRTSLEAALNARRPPYLRFRWAQDRLPAPNGWAAIGLLAAAMAYGLLGNPTELGKATWGYFWVAMVFAILFPLAGTKDPRDPRRHASFRFLALHSLNGMALVIFALLAVAQRSNPTAPTALHALIMAASALTYALLMSGQLASWYLRRLNGGYWNPRAFSATNPVHELVDETLHDLEPARQQLRAHNARWWERTAGTLKTADDRILHPACLEAKRRLEKLEILIRQIEETSARSRDPATLERLPGSGDAEERLRADLVHAYRSLLQALDEADPAAAEGQDGIQGSENNKRRDRT